MDRSLRNEKVRPVLKWVGGKRQLLPDLIKRVPTNIGTYYEPFVGGGALFFKLAAQGRIGRAFLSDINPSVVDVYIGIRDCVDDVIKILKQYYYEEAYYYKIRALDRDTLSLSEKAARVIYLNKTCYNGLYRENRAGKFNVPFGKHKNPTICDEKNLRAVSHVLQSVQIFHRHFSSIVQIAQPDDFVYFDPPYHPVSVTSNFTAYSRHRFGEGEQKELRAIFSILTQRGVKAMLSNSDTPFIRDLYADYNISQVFASRAVNSKASSRGKIPEVVVCNYAFPDEMDHASTEQVMPYELQRGSISS